MLPNTFHQHKLLGASDSTFETADFPLLVAVFSEGETVDGSEIPRPTTSHGGETL